MDRREVIELPPSGATPASLLVSIVELRFPFASHARRKATGHGVFTWKTARRTRMGDTLGDRWRPRVSRRRSFRFP